MPRTKTKSLDKEIKTAWKLLHSLAAQLQRIDALRKEPDLPSSAASKKKEVKPTKSRKVVAGLPDTTGDFFLRHVTKRKQPVGAIFESVLNSVDKKLTTEQRAVIRNRLVVWLSNSVKSDSSPVVSVGSGTERRYFKT